MSPVTTVGTPQLHPTHYLHSPVAADLLLQLGKGVGSEGRLPKKRFCGGKRRGGGRWRGGNQP